MAGRSRHPSYCSRLALTWIAVIAGLSAKSADGAVARSLKPRIYDLDASAVEVGHVAGRQRGAL